MRTCDSDPDESWVCSVGTGVCLWDFITLHANSNGGWPPRREVRVEEDGGTDREREGEMKHVGNGQSERGGEDGVMTEL